MPVLSLAIVASPSNLSIHNESTVGWVAGPDNRGTMSLLLSALTTILLCTWTVLHLDVPRNDKERTMTSTFRRKATWMTIAAVAPEIVVSLAVGQFFIARQIRKAMPPRGGGSEWSLTQAFFLHMGGLMYTTPGPHGASATVIALKGLGGKIVHRYNASLFEGTLNFETIPNDAVIWDKSKSDGLTKSLALLQCAWFVSQVIARAIGSMPITILELGTTAFIGCASVAYGFWWYKPQDVRTSIEIQTPHGLNRTPDNNPFMSYDSIYDALNNPIMPAAFALAALFIGGIHCAAWNSLFPTPIERILWRVASILVLSLAPLEYLMIFVSTSYSHVLEWTGRYLIPGLYVILRLFIIIEMFASLRKVPPAVYHQPHWSDFIPHL
jgi:hypothetical protein